MGPTEYRSRTVFEDVSPELVRDFFWDDEFREVWDDMLIQTKTWEECKETGSMIVQWTRKVYLVNIPICSSLSRLFVCHTGSTLNEVLSYIFLWESTSGCWLKVRRSEVEVWENSGRAQFRIDKGWGCTCVPELYALDSTSNSNLPTVFANDVTWFGVSVSFFLQGS